MSFTTKIIIIFLIIILAIYWYYILFKAEVNKKVSVVLETENKKLNEQRFFLQQQELSIKLRKQEFAQLEQVKLSELHKKKEELDRYYQKSFSNFKEAEEIRDNANEKIALLEKRISQLQHELYCARQRSKKLVKQAKIVL
jgi:flagellar motor component MotA